MVPMRSFYFKATPYALVKTTTRVAAAIMLLSLTACSLFGPLGPVPEQVQNDVPTGPGLFTGESGEFSVSDFFDPEKRNKNRSRDITVTGSDVDIPAIDLDSFEEFERFKAWRRAQEVGSIDYQDWLDYQDFLRLKAEK
jgi:predicted small lipoprotein YifL